VDESQQILSAHGRFYLVAVKQNDPEGIIAKMREKGLDGKVAMQRRAGRESLYILRFQRSDG
jgi:release factor glutamine methyltransferase